MASKWVAMPDEPKIDFDKLTKSKVVEIAEWNINEVHRLRKVLGEEMQRADIAEERMREAESKLGKAESFVEQGRGMIESVMEKWYHYEG